jgi:hypothetical protein
MQVRVIIMLFRALSSEKDPISSESGIDLFDYS